MTTSFKGFPLQTLRFLGELSAHNNREWFAENKPRYESDVLQPALQFIDAMAPQLAKFAPRFRASSRRMGGSLMRVYRDTRFARDKRPYKTNIGIQFRHELGKDVHAPGFYLHIEPGEVFLGAGIWRPDSRSLARLREAILDNPAAWKKARNDRGFSSRFALGGDSLQRPPRGVDPAHPLLEDLKRKDFIGTMPLQDTDIQKKDFLNKVSKAYQAAAPFMEFLCLALEIPYK